MGFAQRSGITFDSNGDITLVSGDGHRTVIARHDHCNGINSTPDGQMLACVVSRGLDDHGFRPQFQVELYHADGRKVVLEPGGSIREWHFWNDSQQIAISFKANDGHVWDALYEAGYGGLVAREEESGDLSQLPQWAKSQSQVSDESVPMDADSQAMRNQWMDKVLREMEAIRPGMHRGDLSALFRQDGGINPIGHQERYVLKECPTIKIDVSFRNPDGSDRLDRESPDDVIDSISKPYLQWAIMD
jgi:hypothetical protein